jgi:hypothetical protein
MSGFTADWLSLREPADARARNAKLSDQLVQLARRQVPARLMDLACGTGANLRYLAPLIGTQQQWLLVDDDSVLLEKVRAVPGCNVRTQRFDLVTQLQMLDFGSDVIVTASALLDLVSERWLAQLIDRCRASRCSAFFALTYDGRITLTPSEPDDEWIRQLVNRHQRGDKGFGPALGPSASRRARELFERAGYEVLTAPSDWSLLPEERLLQQSLLEGWAGAAMELAPTQSNRCREWLARRLSHLATGASHITVGHEDLLARPRD